MDKSNVFIEALCDKFKRNTELPPIDYDMYGIKRGLRNADGTGVMAGVSKIGSVQGYVIRDGERVPAPGQLFYRGIDLQKIVDGFWEEGRLGMAETAYLLLFGELPDRGEHARFSSLLTECHEIPDGCFDGIFVKSGSTSIMNMLARSVLTLYAHDSRADDTSLPNLMRQSIRLIGAFPSIVASGYASIHGRYDREEHFVRNHTQTLAENFLYRLRPDHCYTQEEARLLDLCLVLHAEHGGGNNSSFTCRVLSSSGTDTYSAIAGAISSLKGPLHGGANIKVARMIRDMMENIRDLEDEDEIRRYLRRILNREAGDRSGKIYGIGHAVYTVSDPRAVLLKEHTQKLVASSSGEDRREFAFMERVERLAPEVFYEHRPNVEKMISANVDFYSGMIYRMLGIPEELYTPLFATARVCGWTAHRIEEVTLGGRIIRPAYKSMGRKNGYRPMAMR